MNLKDRLEKATVKRGITRNPIVLRANEEMKIALEDLSAELGIPQAVLIRVAIQELLDRKNKAK